MTPLDAAVGRERPIELQHLDHWFGEGETAKQVLIDINLTVHAGEILILTGPSGSGKTTLLTMLGGLRAAQSGSLRVLGEELLHADNDALTRLRRQAGFIFQAHNLLPYLTAQENVRFGLEVSPTWLARGRAAMDDCAAAMLGHVGLAERQHYFPEKLSGGQKQRVAIARALAPSPRLLLADEPTAALDKTSGRDVVDLFRQLADDNGAAIVMVTHDNKILDIADRIVTLEGGQLVES
ncbi:ATP-binding cassette domain-containing protein [Cyanobium sp. Cruz CV13-4-11]|jgi:putative ABC transport system ATP-binding protein|uniref:ATP-binding cassette domain-containing protein n=1 Tax=unclassified Cyanobium TaxID=2627006 RepID=UPI0020CD73E5|nr:MULTISPECIES: ATP-binding cassette domain-containing protein [unclassified Cyanobium]MCP9899505.1 ATP-binding cassette domain-containing protein [Cyanobium sp. Cruz CV11-17]MCP9918748.1 ATP-binding cassette domain-containing protein [Cyanobium sp. Cruz CV13-4-11]